MTPSFMGLMATMLPGVRPSISFASLPTASTSLVFLFSATMEGSLTTMPLPRAYTSVFAVPRSMARSLENMLNSERRLCEREEPLPNPLFDIEKLLSSGESSRLWNLGLRQFPSEPLFPGFFSFVFPLFYFDVQENCLSSGYSVVRSVIPNIAYLLNHHFFLVGIHPTFGILCGDRDQVFAVRQGRREIVERAIVSDDRHFLAVHHDACSHLGLARDLNHVPVLDERIDLKRQVYFFLRL